MALGTNRHSGKVIKFRQFSKTKQSAFQLFLEQYSGSKIPLSTGVEMSSALIETRANRWVKGGGTKEYSGFPRPHDYFFQTLT